MKVMRVVAVVALLLAGLACSSEKKVGTAIDLKSLSEKNKALGEVKQNEKKGANAGVILGQGTPTPNPQKKAAEAQAAQQAEIQKRQKEAAVPVIIDGQGFNPAKVEIFLGGSITVTNRYTKRESYYEEHDAFDSGWLEPGETWTFTPTRAGTFGIRDRGRVYVVGQLVVHPQ